MLANKSRITFTAVALLGLGLSGCATEQGAAKSDAKTETVKAATVETKAALPQKYYEVHKDGRIWVFGSGKVYRPFLKGKEVAYVLTRIGAGPKRTTVVYVRNKAQSKKTPDELIAKFRQFHGM